MATDGSMPISATRGSAAGPVAVSASISARATTMPRAPPSDAEDGGFGENVSDDAAAGGAERGADRELLLVGRGADEEELGDVRAGHQQDEHDGPEEHPQHRRGSAGHFFVQ